MCVCLSVCLSTRANLQAGSSTHLISNHSSLCYMSGGGVSPLCVYVCGEGGGDEPPQKLPFVEIKFCAYISFACIRTSIKKM